MSVILSTVRENFFTEKKIKHIKNTKVNSFYEIDNLSRTVEDGTYTTSFSNFFFFYTKTKFVLE